MVFGKPRSQRARRAAPRPPRATALLAAAFLAITLSTCLSSCGAASERRRIAAFSTSLRSLDYLIGSRAASKFERAFSAASSYARESSDWLSLLKRARAAAAAGDGGRYAKTADRARKAFPASEPIAAVAAHAYLGSGRPADALALFPKPLSPDGRPSLWAEAFIASRGARAQSADYGRLAEIIGDPRAFLGAAAAALASGDALSARAWLSKGLAAGVRAPPLLLWDCGLYEALAALPDAASASGELALMGDAAWIIGDRDLAKRRWERSISLSPRRSWKPYAELAYVSASSEAGDSYWARLKAAFLSGPDSADRDGALAAYSLNLARRGREAEALAALEGAASTDGRGSGYLAILAVLIKGRAESEGRYVAELEGLAAARPEDPEVIGAALRELAIRGMYGEMAVLRESAARRKVALAYGQYYDALMLAARGDFPAAVISLRAAPSADNSSGDYTSGDYLSPRGYAIGSLYTSMGDSAKSAQAFSEAAASARSPRDRCESLKALGRALGAFGDAAGAARAYRSASLADPRDPEASILARAATGSK